MPRYGLLRTCLAALALTALHGWPESTPAVDNGVGEVKKQSPPRGLQWQYTDDKHTPVSNRTDKRQPVRKQRPLALEGGQFLGRESASLLATRGKKDFSAAIPDSQLDLPPASVASYTPKLVCDNDDRKPVLNTTIFPWKCIASLVIEAYDGSRYSGSGFFIAPKCIITSGHNVFLRDHWARSITVIPGQNGRTAPFGTQQSREFWSVKGWVDGHHSLESEDYDYGAVILPDATLSLRLRAYFGYGVATNLFSTSVSGYPAEKRPAGTQWQADAQIEHNNNLHRIYYSADGTRGQSGSPVWTNDGGKLVVVGVHSYGGCPNSAIRCADDVLANWTLWSGR